MILNFDQIVRATKGAAYVEENGKWARFHRFTEKEEAIYRELHVDKCNKLLATAGVRVAFCTDSASLAFSFRFFEQCSSRDIRRIDVYVNGAMIAHVGSDSCEIDEERVTLNLGNGEKTVEFYLPWSMGCEIGAITLDDGAAFVPARRRYSMISYGDSITHGYDAAYPSLSYAVTLARLMDADSTNKGIGGEFFFPELLEGAVIEQPDFVTVAYGTNDWCTYPRVETEAKCRAFYKTLSALYPNAKIFAIAPIWRGNGKASNLPFGSPVTDVYHMICEKTADLANVTVICGDNLIPHVKEFTSDALHPNDLGMQIYAQNLYLKIEQYL